jgi:hypothetical protein
LNSSNKAELEANAEVDHEFHCVSAASTIDPAKQAIDSANAFYWRMSLRD